MTESLARGITWPVPSYGGFLIVQLPYFHNLVAIRSIEPENTDFAADIMVEHRA